jgi:WD40 repeat protein
MSAAFSTNSRVLATAGADSKSHFFDCLSGEEIRTIDYGANGFAIAFNHDDSLVATARGDGTIWISAVSTGETVQRIANVGVVFAIALQGEMIATAGQDHSARIFDIRTGQQIWRVDLQSPVFRTSFGPGVISTTEGFDLLRTHRLRREALIDKACSRLTRNLTEVEWHRYFGDEPYRRTCSPTTQKRME